MKKIGMKRATTHHNRTGVESDSDSNGLCRTVQRRLPLKNANDSEKSLEEIRHILAQYKSLRVANDSQLTARQARTGLKRGISHSATALGTRSVFQHRFSTP